MYTKNKLSRFAKSVLVAIVVLGPAALFAQPDFIEQSRLFPPGYLSKDQSESSLASLSWQLTHQRTLFNKYKASRDQISKKLDAYSHLILKLNQQIPAEIRLIDSAVRSQLIGKAMEQLLDAKLDLATMKESVSVLESKLSDSSSTELSELKKRELEIETKVAQRRYVLARSEYDKMKKLQSTGSLSEQQTTRARISSEIAEIEFEAAQTRAEIEKAQLKVAAAERLADERVGIKPIKARITAIEEFLKIFSDSANVTAEVESKKREMELWQNDLQLVANELFQINREMDELETLKNGIEQRLKANQKKEKEN